VTNPASSWGLSASDNLTALCHTILIGFLAAIDHGYAAAAMKLSRR